MENNFSTIKGRVVELVKYKGITLESFFEMIGMTSANFRGSSKKRPLNSTAIENIFSLIPDVNLEWLITGKGEMLKKTETALVHQQNTFGNNVNAQGEGTKINAEGEVHLKYLEALQRKDEQVDKLIAHITSQTDK